MNIEVDQSGKIEDTSKNTVVAFSNAEFKSIFISMQDKREVQKIFRKIGRSRVFVYKLFAILIFLLVKKYLKRIDQIIIDEEYPGKAKLIKNFLLQEIRKIKQDFDKNDIVFKRIGKKSRVHYLAYGVAIGKRKADIKVTTRDILRIMIK